MTTEPLKHDLGQIAVIIVRSLTPLLLMALVFIGTRTINSLDELVKTVQALQITQAQEQAINAAERASSSARFSETLRSLTDHEDRLRKVEARRCKTCPSDS